MGDEPEENDSLKKARDMIEYIEDQVIRGKEMGIEFSEVQALIQGAKMMIESDVLLDAQDLIDQATEMASLRFTEFQLLQVNIKKLEMKIKETTLGDDTEEAEKNLKMAKYHQNTGYYRLGNDYATRGMKLFTEKKEIEYKWGSGL